MIKTADITIDDLTTFRATYDPAIRWNGWLGAPAFDRSEVERIIAWAEGSTFTWDGDVLIHSEDDYAAEDPEGYKPERIEPDENGRYTVGAFNWVWSELDEE